MANYPWSDGSPPWADPNNGGGGGGDSFGAGGGGFGPGFDVRQAMTVRRAHGILAAFIFVIVFPVGAILLRILPGKLGLWVHAILQVLAYLGYVAAAALGIWLMQNVNLGGRTLWDIPRISFHPIIGLVILAMLFFQPLLGIMHHRNFKRLGRRTGWSYAHVWNGRIGIILGFINGGLGLWIAGASDGLRTGYAIVAGVMGVLWVASMLLGRIRRSRSRKATTDA